MNHLSTSILSAAILASAANAAACVDSVLVDVFDYINECRTSATCEAATDYAANMGNIADGEEEWPLNNNGGSDEYVVQFYSTTGQNLADGDTTMEALAAYVTSPTDDVLVESMTWSEGLALAAASYTAEWAQNSTFTSMTTPNGTTTTSRAAANGTVTGAITESAYFYTTYAVDPIDMMRFIIANDGSSVMKDAMFGVDATYLNEYLYMGASYALTSGCSMNTIGPVACSMVFDVVVASGYTNNSDVAACTTTVSYGGGDCDPDDAGLALYEAINEMRLNTATWAKWITIGDGDALITSSNSLSITATAGITNAQVAAGESGSMTLIRGTSNVTDAVSAITAATGRSELEWTGGLAMAAYDQATYLATQTSLSSTGSGDSTFADRIAGYGTAGNDCAEILHGSDNTPTWIVLDMLIDDKDTTNTSRTALLSSAVSQAGVMGAANETFTTVYVAAVDSAFVASATFACEAVTVVTEVEAATALVAATSAAFAAALLM